MSNFKNLEGLVVAKSPKISQNKAWIFFVSIEQTCGSESNIVFRDNFVHLYYDSIVIGNTYNFSNLIEIVLTVGENNIYELYSNTESTQLLEYPMDNFTSECYNHTTIKTINMDFDENMLINYTGTISTEYDGLCFKVDKEYKIYMIHYYYDKSNKLQFGTEVRLLNVHIVKKDGKILGFGLCTRSHIEIVKESKIGKPPNVRQSELMYYFHKLPIKDFAQLRILYSQLKKCLHIDKETIERKKVFQSLLKYFNIKFKKKNVVDEFINHSTHCWINKSFNTFPSILSIKDLFSSQIVKDEIKKCSRSKRWNYISISSEKIRNELDGLIIGRLICNTSQEPKHCLKLKDNTGEYPIIFTDSISFYYIDGVYLLKKFDIIVENVIEKDSINIGNIHDFKKLECQPLLTYIQCKKDDIFNLYINNKIYNYITRQSIYLKDPHRKSDPNEEPYIIKVLAKSGIKDIDKKKGLDPYFSIDALCVKTLLPSDSEPKIITIIFENNFIPKWNIIMPGRTYYISKLADSEDKYKFTVQSIIVDVTLEIDYSGKSRNRFDPLRITISEKLYKQFRSEVESCNHYYSSIYNIRSLKILKGVSENMSFIDDGLLRDNCSVICEVVDKVHENSYIYIEPLWKFNFFDVGKYNIKVRDVNGLDTIDVYIDLSHCPYLLGIIPGVILLLENVDICKTKSNNFYINFNENSSCRIMGVNQSLEQTNIEDDYEFKKLIDFKNIDYTDKRVYKFRCDLYKYSSWNLSMTCNLCSNTVKYNNCSYGCNCNDYNVNIKCVCRVHDGTSYATVLISGNDVWTIMSLSTEEKEYLIDYVATHGELKYFNGKMHNYNDTLNFEDVKTVQIKKVIGMLQYSFVPIIILGNVKAKIKNDSFSQVKEDSSLFIYAERVILQTDNNLILNKMLYSK